MHNTGCGDATEALANRADDDHAALDPFAQRMRATAVGHTQDGVTVVGAGAVISRACSERWPRRGGLLARLARAHAEPTVLHGMIQNGKSPAALAATRDFCAACRSIIEEFGGAITGPRTAVWRLGS